MQHKAKCKLLSFTRYSFRYCFVSTFSFAYSKKPETVSKIQTISVDGELPVFSKIIKGKSLSEKFSL